MLAPVQGVCTQQRKTQGKNVSLGRLLCEGAQLGLGWGARKSKQGLKKIRNKGDAHPFW